MHFQWWLQDIKTVREGFWGKIIQGQLISHQTQEGGDKSNQIKENPFSFGKTLVFGGGDKSPLW